ncbi:hypothetical protein ACET3Z_009190 [Daucus carota]
MERNNNSVKGQQAGLRGVGKIDQIGGGDNHMAAVDADGGRSGIAATGSNNEKQIDASEAYFKDREQLDMLGKDEFDQFCRWLKNENTRLKNEITRLKEENNALRQLINDNRPNCACGCEDGGEDSEGDNGGH